MAPSRVAPPALVWLVAVAGAAGCGRIGYDRLWPDAGVPGFGGSGGGFGGAGGSVLTGSGGVTGQGGFTGGGGQGGSSGAGGTGGAAGQGGSGVDASQPDTGSPELTPPNDASGPPAMCSQAGTPTRVWSFDTGLDAWALSGSGTIVWNGTTGDPTPGALQIDWGGGSTTHPRLAQALGDLRGRIVTAEVFVEPGTSATFKLFAQTGMRLAWADGGLVTPPAGQWTCLALDLDNPTFSRQQYDPTDVQIIGVELDSTSGGRVYVDQVAY